jgi:hypothetical protein
MGMTDTAITRDLVAKHGGWTLLNKHKSLSKLLQLYYPAGYTAPKVYFGQRTQRYLTALVKSMFKGEIVEANYKHIDLRFNSTFCIH